MTAIDAALVQRFVALAADRLAGDWVIVGGAVLPLLGLPARVTWDIDVAGPDDAGNAALLVLMDTALELGLPVEAINPAAAFFLRRIPGWRQRLVLVREGQRGRVLRPDATLFALLKIGRLSETDLSDTLAVLAWARAQGEAVDGGLLASAIDKALAEADAPKDKCARLGQLRASRLLA